VSTVSQAAMHPWPNTPRGGGPQSELRLLLHSSLHVLSTLRYYFDSSFYSTPYRANVRSTWLVKVCQADAECSLQSTRTPGPGHTHIPDHIDSPNPLRYPSSLPEYSNMYDLRERDGIRWWNTQISNPVLPAFEAHPRIRQAEEASPLTDVGVPETVDMLYSLRLMNGKGRLWRY